MTGAFPAPQPVTYPLRSILERLSLAELFPRKQPVQVELGSGDGSFLVSYAKAHPDQNFIGVERLLGRARKLERKVGRAGLENVRGVRIESSYFLQWLLPAQSIVAIHVYFPDPWPKRKHARHRLINEHFPSLAQQVLEPGGHVFLRTDHEDYHQQMIEVFARAPLFRPVDTPAALAQQITDFERDFSARGVKTLRAAFELVNGKSLLDAS